MEIIQVQPKDFYLHYVYVPTKDTIIRWTFTTRKNNIAFGLYRKSNQISLPSLSEKKADTINTNRPRSKSQASEKLREMDDWIEVIPIEHVNSVKTKVEGSYTAQVPGHYVLVFDNTFSINTPKIVAFSVSLNDIQQEETNKWIKTGWLLKKRRKKLQGWAKRWFQLSKSGLLSYSEQPEGITRGSIQITLAAVSFNPQQLLIHVDSGSSLFHLKCTEKQDFKDWTKAFQTIKDMSFETMDDALNDHDNILCHINRGIRNADLLIQNMRTLKKNTAHFLKKSHNDDDDDDNSHGHAQQQVIKKEADRIISLANEQKEQWHQVQNMVQHLINTNSPPIMSPRRSSRSKNLNDHDFVKSSRLSQQNRKSYSKSIQSEQYYDANSMLLTSTEDDDSLDDSIHSNSSSTTEEEEEEEIVVDDNSPKSINSISESFNFHRRQNLPSPAVANEVSALSIFRKNIGKDLTQIAMPVSMNEPLSMLEKACEELEYCDLLDKAAESTDSMDRLMYVVAFAVSSYASSQWRTNRKPFNPILTETYECIRPDKGFRFLSEKVSHHPLVIAAYAESHRYTYWQSTRLKSKFWGKSMEFIAEGTFHVKLNNKEEFTFTKPSSWLRNMIAGEKYLEHVGEMKVLNHTTGEYALVEFKEGTGGGLFSTPKERNHVQGLLYTANGEKKKRVAGKWSESLAEDVGLNDQTFSVIWRVRPPPCLDICKKYYGFTPFAIELNEITPIEKGKLPKTDSRLRPDQRLYEQGKVELADQEKTRIEKKQRETRAWFEENNKSWQPLWFQLEQQEPTSRSSSREEGTAHPSWKFSGEYWHVRESGQWPEDTPELW